MNSIGFFIYLKRLILHFIDKRSRIVLVEGWLQESDGESGSEGSQARPNRRPIPLDLNLHVFTGFGK
jgi:hypothetical protein